MDDSTSSIDGTLRSESPEVRVSGDRRMSARLVVGAALLAGAALLWWGAGDRLSFGNLVRSEGALRDMQERHPQLLQAAVFATYVLVAACSLPGATAMTLISGWLFGFLRGTLLVSFASTGGASLAFLLSRHLFRNALVSRFGDRTRRFEESLAADGPFYLFTLRLVPAVPFFVVNAVSGLTPLRLRTFWWVSQLGMLPGTAAYVYAGSRLPGLERLGAEGIRGVLTTELVTSFVLLGLFPLAARKLLSYRAGKGAAVAGGSRDTGDAGIRTEVAGAADGDVQTPSGPFVEPVGVADRA